MADRKSRMPPETDSSGSAMAQPVHPNPQPPLVRLMLDATAAQERGDFSAAEASYAELTERFPNFPDAWHYYGILLHQRGESGRALQLLRQADRLDSRNLVFLLNFATVLREQRHLDESLKVLRRAYDIDPDHAQIFAQLTQIHLLLQRGGDLIAEVENRLKAHPENWRLWMLFGECLEQGGERERAMEAFGHAGELAPPGEVDPQLRRGWSARAAGAVARAETAFSTALKINPECAQGYVGLATCASERGRFHRCERFARKALELDSGAHAASRLLAASSDNWRDDAFLRSLDDSARTCTDNDRHAWLLHFARGYVREKRGEYDAAFEAYAKGNSLRSRVRPYSAVDHHAFTSNIVSELGADFLGRRDDVGAPAPDAIFICGMPRSGTTLVETILASHPDVSPGGEMRHIHDELRRRIRDGSQSRIGTWLRNAPSKELRSIAQGWRRALADAGGNSPRVTDKMPGNFSLLGLIDVCLPGARIVHVKRDARDNCWSCYTTPFSEGSEFSYELASLGHFYRHYLALMEHWRSSLERGRIVEVEYERLVADPEEEIRKLLERLGLAWNPRCLEFHKTRRVVATASLFQVRQPLYTSSVGRWRRFESHLAPLLAALEEPAAET